MRLSKKRKRKEENMKIRRRIKEEQRRKKNEKDMYEKITLMKSYEFGKYSYYHYTILLLLFYQGVNNCILYWK